MEETIKATFTDVDRISVRLSLTVSQSTTEHSDLGSESLISCDDSLSSSLRSSNSSSLIEAVFGNEDERIRSTFLGINFF